MDIVDRNLDRYVDVLYVVLLNSGKYTFLPEIMDVIGKKNMIRFLDIFGGTTIEVPSFEDLKRHVRNVTIYVRLSSCRKSTFRSEVKDLATEYQLDEKSITDTFANMKVLVEEDYNLEFVFKKIREQMQ